jgi:hypothetical protein
MKRPKSWWYKRMLGLPCPCLVQGISNGSEWVDKRPWSTWVRLTTEPVKMTMVVWHGNETNSTCRQYVIQADLATIVAYLCQIRNILLHSCTMLENLTRILAYSVINIVYTTPQFWQTSVWGKHMFASSFWQMRPRATGLSYYFKTLTYYAKVFAYYGHNSDVSDSIVLIPANYGANLEYFASVVAYKLIIFT